MSAPRIQLTDELLKRALAERADAGAIVGGDLLSEIVAAAEATSQRKTRWPLMPQLSQRAILVLAAALLVAALAAASVGARLLRPQAVLLPENGPLVVRPTASATVSPVKPPPRGGSFVVLRDGSFTMIDAETGDSATLGASDRAAGAHDLTWGAGLLAFATDDGVYVAEPSRGPSSTIMSCAPGPRACTVAWSPDGSLMAVAHDGRLEVMDPEGFNRATLHSIPASIISQPTWSPDGQRIAFHAMDWQSDDQRRRLYVIDRDGSDLALLLGPMPNGSIGTWEPAWSPDGSTIAYIGSTSPAQNEWRLSVMLLGLEGSGPVHLREIGSCIHPCWTPSGVVWSPDGTSLAFIDEDGQLVVMTSTGQEPRSLGTVGHGPLVWQPFP